MSVSPFRVGGPVTGEFFTDLRDRFFSSLPGGFFGLFEGLQNLVPFLEVVLSDPSTGFRTYRFRTGATRKQEPGDREQILRYAMPDSVPGDLL